MLNAAAVYHTVEYNVEFCIKYFNLFLATAVGEPVIGSDTPSLLAGIRKNPNEWFPAWSGQVWTLAIVPLTWVRLVTSSALQYQKWQLIGMSQWCRSTLCGHPMPAIMDNWTHSAASRHTIASLSHTRPSPHSRNYYSFPIPLRVGGWVSLSTQ